METLKNDLIQGNKNIINASEILELPLKTILTSQIIFQYVYPRLYKRESYDDVSFICVYIASKIEETHIKIDSLIKTICGIKNLKSNICKEGLISSESTIIECLRFNFEIHHCHIFFLRMCKTLNLSKEEAIKGIRKLDDLHSSPKVNLINYFGDGIYSPEDVAISLLGAGDLLELEKQFLVKVDDKILRDIRKRIFDN